MTNKKTEGRYEKAQFNELCKVLIASPGMGYFEALAEVGSENMPSMYDVASVKRYFHKRGKLDVLSDPGIIFEKDDPQFKKLILEGKVQKNVGVSSHLDNPDVRYMWTNEYLGIAPEGHPAEGELIMAKVEGIDMTKKIGHPLGFLGSEDGKQRGQIIISTDKYVLLKDTDLRYMQDGDTLWCGQIQGFQEINGLMVPFTNSGYRPDCNRFQSEKEDKGFGDLTFRGKNNDPAPIALRPSSWSDLGFNRNNSLSSRFKVLTRESLERLLK